MIYKIVETQEVKCSTFLDTEKVIKKTDAKIRETRITKEKRYYAGDILVEAKTLLSCSNYNTENPECLNCHSISHKLIQEYVPLTKDNRRNSAIDKWLAKNRSHLKRGNR